MTTSPVLPVQFLIPSPPECLGSLFWHSLPSSILGRVVVNIEIVPYRTVPMPPFPWPESKSEINKINQNWTRNRILLFEHLSKSSFYQWSMIYYDQRIIRKKYVRFQFILYNGYITCLHPVRIYCF